MGLVTCSVVHTPLELDDHAFASAVKVNDEPVKGADPSSENANAIAC